MTNQIRLAFPILTSLVEEDIDYISDDLRSRFLWVLEIFGDHYVQYEKTLSKMPDSEKDYIFQKLSSYVKKHQILGWHQFYDVLVEVEAYQHLQDNGASNVSFIKEKKCPDLEATIGGNTILLEVKNIHNSLDESSYLIESAIKPKARTVGTEIPDGLKNKIDSDIAKAMSQLDSYKSKENPQKCIYMVIHPDLGVKLNNDLWGEMDNWLDNKKHELESSGYFFEPKLRW